MTEPKIRRISPSQLELFHRCNRRWAFVHRAKRKTPFSGAAQAGTETHLVLENQGPWDKEWTAPDTGRVYPVGQMAALIQAQTPDGVVAREKRWEFEIEGLPFVCVTDFYSEEIVGDAKTTSRIKNAKSKAKLLDDPQRLLNSAVVPTATKTTWLYGAWDTMHVTARECDIDRAADKERIHLRVLKPAEIMLDTPDDVDPLSMKPNVNDCALFPPHGCEFKNECFPPGKLAPVVRESKESQKQMSSLIERLRAKAATQGTEQAAEPAKVVIPSPPPELVPTAAERAAFEVMRAPNSATRGAQLEPFELTLQQVAPAPLPQRDGKLVGTLYVDCLPLDESFTNAALLVAAAAEEVANDAQVPHALLIDFSRGGPAIAAQLRANLSGGFIERLYLETKSTEGRACVNVLMSVAQRTVKGVF